MFSHATFLTGNDGLYFTAKTKGIKNNCVIFAPWRSKYSLIKKKRPDHVCARGC